MSQTIDTMVGQYRKRARSVLFARTALLLIAVATISVTLWGLTSPTATQVGWAVVVGIVSSLMISAIVAVIRTPSLSAMADVIDRRLATQNHVAAALQLSRDENAMSMLVVRGAMRKLNGVRPADVVPMALTRHATAAAVCLALALLVIARQQPPSSGARAGATDAAGAQLRETANAPDPDAEVADASAQTVASNPADQPKMMPRSVPSTSSTVQQDGDDAALPRSARSNDANSSDATSTDLRAPQEEPRSTPGASTSERAASGASRASDPTSTAAASTGMSASNSSAGAGGAIPSQGDRQAGGVSEGGLNNREVTSPIAPSSPVSARIEAVARSQAATAMVNDDIPPRFRRYVRNYFLRLQSTGGRQ